MTRRKRDPKKQELIKQLVSEYGVESIADIQNALKDLLGGTIEELLQAEINNHLGYEKYGHGDKENYRNGYKEKKVQSNYGDLEIAVPQDRNSTFEPMIVPKREKDISEIENKIIGLYALGMTTRDIAQEIKELYGCEISEGLVSDITDKIIPKIEEWKTRTLDEVYAVIYIDAVHFSVKENGIVGKKAVYITLGVNPEGKKDILSMYIGTNESAKTWLSLFNDLKNRGVKDILVMCADGLTGIKEAIAAAFPKTEYQRCIVHMIRNTTKFVATKDYKELCADLKTIYNAPTEEQAQNNLDIVADKWESKYPKLMNSWYSEWDAITPIFKFSVKVRTVIYTTNAVESVNSRLRSMNKRRSVFPNKVSLEKALYLAIERIVKKWTGAIRDWGQIYGELRIMYEDRI